VPVQALCQFCRARRLPVHDDEARRAEIEWFSGAVRAALEEGWPQLPADPPPPPPTKLEKLHRKAKELGYRIIDAVDDRDDDRDED